MTNDTLLFAAAQLRKHCKETSCEKCIFSNKEKYLKFIICRINEVPNNWDIDKLIGENH